MNFLIFAPIFHLSWVTKGFILIGGWSAKCLAKSDEMVK